MPRLTTDNSKNNIQHDTDYSFLFACMAGLIEGIAAAGGFILAATLTNSPATVARAGLATNALATTALSTTAVVTSSSILSVILPVAGLLLLIGGLCLLAAILSDSDCSPTYSNAPGGFYGNGYGYGGGWNAGPGFWSEGPTHHQHGNFGQHHNHSTHHSDGGNTTYHDSHGSSHAGHTTFHH